MTGTDERSLLGCMMKSRNAVDTALEFITVEDFGDHRLMPVFMAVVTLERQGVTDQPDAVARHMDGGDLDRAGGLDGIVAMWLDGQPASTAYYARRVAAQAAVRRVKEAGMRVQQMADESDDAVDPHELVEAAYSALDQAKPTHDRATGQVGEVLDDVLEALDAAPRYVPTPWTRVNELVDGFRPGALYVVGARPGAGKSILGLQCAAHMASSGHVAMSSLEMSRAELMERLLAQRGGIHMSNLARRTLGRADWDRIAKVQAGLRDLRVHIDDRSGVTLPQVRAHVRSVARRGPLSGVVVDYLQLLRATDTRKPRWEQVSEFSHGLKVLAREFDVPVIALAQLNRESESDRRPPRLSDLRESGSIEQDADVVALMQRGYDDATGRQTDDLEFYVAKNRRGLTGMATLLWEGQFARLSDPVWGA